MKKNMEENKLKKKSFKRFVMSFKYCYQGMKYAFYNEINIMVMIVVAILTLILGYFLKINYIESLIIVVIIGIVLSLEMVNTAIEAVVDMETKENNKLAKVAKDCASGAVGIMSIISAIIGLMIFIPKIIALF